MTIRIGNYALKKLLRSNLSTLADVMHVSALNHLSQYCCHDAGIEVFKGVTDQRSTIGPVDWNGMKNRLKVVVVFWFSFFYNFYSNYGLVC